MAGNLGKATATLDLYNTPFMKALNASGAAFVRTASGMAKVGGLATAAGAAIVTPIIAAAKSFAAYGDNLDKMSGRNGIGVEALQELGFAAEQSGASLDNVSTFRRFFVKLSVKIKRLRRLKSSLFEYKSCLTRQTSDNWESDND